MARYSEQQKAALDALMRDNVFEKAVAIMVSEDMTELTMERLANDVGVSRGTLYNYFDDRDAVLDFVADRTFEPVAVVLQDVVASDLPAEEKLAKVVDRVFETVYEDRAVLVALLPAKQGGGCVENKRARQAEFSGLLERVVREGIESGVFRDVEPTLVTDFFYASVRGMIELMVERGEFHPPETMVPVFKELLLGGLRNTD